MLVGCNHLAALDVSLLTCTLEIYLYTFVSILGIPMWDFLYVTSYISHLYGLSILNVNSLV